MENTVGNLLSLCSTFKDRVSTYISLHKRNRKTLQYHLQLLELLEVPQLIEGCIRNSFYDEAIELANFIYSLERRHLLATEVKASVNQNIMSGTPYLPSSEPTTPATTSGKEGEENKKERMAASGVSVGGGVSLNEGQAVIQKIVNEISDILLNLSSSLLFQLTELSSLPKQIQILSILRKMDSLTIDRILSLERFDALQYYQQQQQQQVLSSVSSSSFDETAAVKEGMKLQSDINRGSSSNSSIKDDSQQLRDIIRQQFLQNSEIKHQMDFLEAKNVWLQRNLENYSSSSATASTSTSSLSEKSSHSSSTSTTSLTNTGTSSTSSQQHHRLGPYGKAVEMLEIRRTSFYSIITQYHALFTDYYQMTLSSSSSASSAGGNKSTLATGTASTMKKKQDGASVSSIASSSSQQHPRPPIVIDDHYPQWTCSLILKAWMTRQIETLLSQLKSLLLLIDDGSSIRSLFEQSLYFASRLGTVGCDFTALLIPLFEEISLNKLKKELEANYQHWVIILKNEKIDLNASKMIPGILKTDNLLVNPNTEQLIPLYHSQDLHPAISENSSSASSSASSTASNAAAADSDFSPSSTLMKYPPLVFFLNNCLLALNYYRDFPLVTLYREICSLFHSYFLKILHYLIENHLIIREKGNKYFGEGYMSNLGTSSTTTTSSASKSATKNNPKNASATTATTPSTTTITEKLDCDYAEAIACDIIPHLYTCLLLSFRKLTISTVKSYCLKHNFSSSASTSAAASASSGHSLKISKLFLNDLKQSKELFGNEITLYLEEYWTLLLSSKLLDEKNVNLLTKKTPTIPFMIPPVPVPPVPPAAPSVPVNVTVPPTSDGLNESSSPAAVIHLENEVGLTNLTTLPDEKDTSTDTSSQY
jgi:hypothetical protein